MAAIGPPSGELHAASKLRFARAAVFAQIRGLPSVLRARLTDGPSTPVGAASSVWSLPVALGGVAVLALVVAALGPVAARQIELEPAR